MNQEQEKTKASLVQAAGVISIATVISRVTGLVRDMVSAQVFGLGRVWDAFVFAFMIPNLLRRLVGEGALSSAFIPVYAEVLNNQGEKEAQRVANIVITFVMCVLAVTLLLIHIGLRVVLATVTLSAKQHLTIELLIIIFPYVFFLALLALAMGVLQCHKHFFVPALTPIILNLIWITTVLFICSHWGTSLESRVRLLAVSILCAGIIQIIVNCIPLIKTGFVTRIIFDFAHPALKKMMYLMLPAALGFSITQLNIFVDLGLAMMLGDGANSALWYGNRIMQFPLGVFGVAMGTALLPTISHQAAKNNLAALKDTLTFSLRSVFLIILPASVGLIVLREPIIQLLFQRGAFDAAATERTALVLLCYCLGLFAYSGVKIIISGFYSLQDTRTPVKVGVLCMILNIALNLIFMQWMREAGLALATTVSSAINFFLLMMLLRKKVGSFSSRHLVTYAGRVLIASVIMGAFSWWFFSLMQSLFSVDSTVLLLIAILLTIVLSCGVFVLACFLLNIHEIKSLFSRGRTAVRQWLR